MNELTKKLTDIIPSRRQLAWHELESYAFIHFGMNTFYDSEWGTGREDPQRFNPTQLDAEQWVLSVKKAHLKGIILTCKHHDGFCLWPSAYTKHSVKYSPYKEGKGDIVKELSEACKKHSIKFGIYLSPWDRHDERYGDSKAYNDYFVNQLTELLTGYGPLFSIWFDGACGEGLNGKKQIYDWQRYYDVIRKLQPEAVITICGPDVRWCGNEAGECRPSEWNVLPRRLSNPNYVAENSQQNDDIAFRERSLCLEDNDLGSREVLRDEKDLIWYPAEVDTSIRPGWFYHKSEDDRVKKVEELIHIYYGALGGNATLLLNIPPDQRGLIHENDVRRLEELGSYLDKTFKDNVAKKANLKVNVEAEEGFEIENILREDQGYYKPKTNSEKIEITLSLKRAECINHVVLREQLAESQRIESFEIWVKEQKDMKKIYEGTVVGSRKICKFEEVETEELIIKIIGSRLYPTLRFVGVYKKQK